MKKEFDIPCNIGKEVFLISIGCQDRKSFKTLSYGVFNFKDKRYVITSKIVSGFIINENMELHLAEDDCHGLIEIKNYFADDDLSKIFYSLEDLCIYIREVLKCEIINKSNMKQFN